MFIGNLPKKDGASSSTEVAESYIYVYIVAAKRRKSTRFRGRKRGEKKLKKRGKKVLTKEKGGGILSKLSPRRGRAPSLFDPDENKKVLDSDDRP